MEIVAPTSEPMVAPVISVDDVPGMDVAVFLTGYWKAPSEGIVVRDTLSLGPATLRGTVD